MIPVPIEARRRRILTRALPLAAVAAAAFAVGAVVGAGESERRKTAERFARAWASGDFGGMYRELSPRSRRAVSREELLDAYREAAETATMLGLEVEDTEGEIAVDGESVVRIGTLAQTRAFGPIAAQLEVPVSSAGVEWGPHLAFPGLQPGEHLEAYLRHPPRAPVLARDGTPLSDDPAGPREHLEAVFDARLSGKPGGTLLAVAGSGRSARILAKDEPRAGAPVRTTIDPELQEAAVAALAGRSGGLVALDARRGDVRAFAGLAASAPQPPGSTFKLLTTTAALQKGIVELDDTFPVVEGVNVGGRFIANAHDEACGGSFREAFAVSCNAVFAPLGPEIGNDLLVATAERFGFNSPPTLYGAGRAREAGLPEPSVPEEIGSDLDLAVTAIGQGELLATPLLMAGVAQTIASGGVRRPTAMVANPGLRPDADPVRVMSRRIAAQLTELMVAVVAGGTGYAGAIAEAQVAGKTGTAELGPAPGQELEAGEEPEQIEDAWFVAFAPAEDPELAVAVMVVNAEGGGGEVAAPLAAEVLSAGI